ncbi:hypothetical protein, partial [Cellulomonas sp. RIT-PI-Y]|uniref:SCO7613 C-terminal domain-containing membrane protein n=1 Tax=Cellulomonas sp. RIT-PI-Y TaxID=3035297 RepID=UPI0021DA623D
APLDLGAVFALAGAGMFGVAALVFAFFLVDDNPLLRVTVLLVSTGISAVGSIVLQQRGLRSSAQAVAWLTAALTVVDCWVLALTAEGTARPVVAAAAFALAAVGGVGLGRRTGLRAWSALVVLAPLVPLLLGAATDDVRGVTLGVAVAAVVTLVRRPFRERIAPTVRARTQVESGALVAWAVLLLAVLPLLVTGSVSGVDPDPSTGLPALVLIGLGAGLALTAMLTVAQGWSEAAPAWSGVAGFLVIGAAASASAAVPTRIAVPVGASVLWVVLLVGAGRWRHGRLHRAAVAGGAVAVLVSALAVLEAVPVIATLLQQAVTADLPRTVPGEVFASDSLGPWRAVVAACCLQGLSLLVGRSVLPDREVRVPGPMFAPGKVAGPRVESRPAWERAVGRVVAPIATLVAAGMVPALLRSWSVAVLVAELVLAAALVEAVRRVPRDRIWFPVLVTGALGQLVLVAVLSWVSRPPLVVGGVLLPLLLLRLRRVTAAELRGWQSAVAVAYPSVVLAVALSWWGWSMSTVSGVLALLLLVVGAGLTPWRRVDTGSWVAVLVVAAVPVVLTCAWSVAERSWAAGWTAAAVAVVEGVLLATRTRPVPDELRMLAAAALLPTASLALVNAGAMVLPGSASPVLLPVLAVLAAAVGLTAPAIGDRLARRGTRAGRTALEWSALATGGLTLLVTLAWPRTGADTLLVVSAVLAAGASAIALRAERRPVWWVAGSLWTGVLWTALVWGGIGLVEAYTVPPALAAVTVGALLARRRPDRWWPLVASGLALLVAPTLVLALTGRLLDPRSTALLAGSAALIASAFLVRFRSLGVLTVPLGWAAGAAASAGPIRSIWLAAETPVGTEAQNAVLFTGALAWAALGAVLLAAAGLLLADRAGRQWALAPALAGFTVAGLCAVRSTWTVVWVALAIELAVLALTVLTVRWARRADGPARGWELPPAWFCWLIALAWAIGGWSLRELRVEAFALPLGLGLTMAGLLAMRSAGRPEAGRAWPIGFEGSMATLAPGVAATLGPSLLAIWTDPITWRAILVVALCLLFMVSGARELLRAPLLIGSITLGLAVLSVFGSQLGSAISAGPWLLTLLSAGGLLLVLGIYAERRKGAEGAPRTALR